MRVFNYRALDEKGQVVEGIVKAPSRFEAEDKIKAKELEVITIKPQHTFLKSMSTISFGKISAWDKSSVYRSKRRDDF